MYWEKTAMKTSLSGPAEGVYPESWERAPLEKEER